jgi:hypothetical protein
MQMQNWTNIASLRFCISQFIVSFNFNRTRNIMSNTQKLLVFFVVGFFMLSMNWSKNTQISLEKKTVAQTDSTIKYDEATGLVVSEGLELVVAHCTGCHSSKLITQFHTDRQGWLEKIRWMQQKQKLWDLGEAEPKILDYLSKNYPPTEKVNRRASLKNIKWYKL